MTKQDMNKDEISALRNEWQAAFTLQTKIEEEHEIRLQQARDAQIAIATKLRGVFGESEMTGPDGKIYVTRKVRNSENLFQFAKKATRTKSVNLDEV